MTSQKTQKGKTGEPTAGEPEEGGPEGDAEARPTEAVDGAEAAESAVGPEDPGGDGAAVRGGSADDATSVEDAGGSGDPEGAPPSFRPVSAGSPVTPAGPESPRSPGSPDSAQGAPDSTDASAGGQRRGLIRRAPKNDEVVTIKVREIFDVVDAREAQAAAERLAAEKAAAQPNWTGQDFVWWNTAAVLTAARAGRRPNPVSPIIDPVRSSFGSGECMLASCDAELLMWRRGDATYNPSRGFFLAGGPVGLALTAAFFSGQAVVNKKRRRAAAADAVEKWRHLANARVTVSTHGIYIGTGEGIMPVGYHEVQEVASTGPGEIVMAASNAKGTARWKLRGQWAELILVLWSVLYMPEHPQVVGRTWLPQGWLDHAAASGYPVDTSTWPRFTPAPPILPLP